MSRRFIPIILVLVVSTFGLTIILKKPDLRGMIPKDFLIEINDPARFVSTHHVAKRLIERDPSLLLIDVREDYQFEEYAIPGAINIPLAESVLPEWEEYLDLVGMDVVFYSNGDVFADQAWVLSAQRGFDNLYIMKGGLNEWFRTIIQPSPPPETASASAIDLYSFELAASMYFGGTSSPSTGAQVVKKEVTVRKKEKKQAEGGC